MRNVVLALACLATVSCVGFVPYADGTVSFGDTAEGILVRGESMPDEGFGFVRARPGEETRFGTPRMLTLIRRGAESVARTFPGTAPLRVGDIAAPTGGRHTRHGSHRTGRDVDLVFYITDLEGRSVRGMSWLGFDRFGVSRETRVPGGGAGSNETFFFDDARNWHLVRTLVLDEEIQVQWIFCSRGVKARLLDYAAAIEPNPEAILRASMLLHQPSTGSPHHDHFHVRIACSPEERAAGCRDRGPIWTWIRKEVDKPADRPGHPLDDAAIIEAIAGDLE